jgi:hypothetical protein
MPITPNLASPLSLITAARRAHPAFKYATAAAGVIGIVVILAQYGISYATLAFGSILLFVIMVMFLVFSQAAAIAKVHLTLPATVLIWVFLLIGVLTALLLFTSAFFDLPLPFKTSIVRQLESGNSVGEVSQQWSSFLYKTNGAGWAGEFRRQGDSWIEFTTSNLVGRRWQQQPYKGGSRIRLIDSNAIVEIDPENKVIYYTDAGYPDYPNLTPLYIITKSN